MALAPGTRLGPYEVGAQIGRGGMGEVYRATDAKLKRQVAIKVLPDSVAHDEQRLARFQREAEVLARLNHPNIAQIYGFEDTPDAKALVMELVEGPTLEDRIAPGALPVDEALAIARQIAEALEAAHEQGIIHRDLKPSNIKLRPDGTVKVLDFGLAKALDRDAANTSSSALLMSPTITTPAMTQVGIILGTAAYMSPEQARGRPIDRRTDIWAFGVVLLEMLTGRRVFDGDDVAEVLGRVVTTEPDWSRLPHDTPPAIQRLLRRALKKEPRQRLSDIRDARLEIDEAGDAVAYTGAGPATRLRERTLWVASVAALTGLSVVLAVPGLRHLRETAPASQPEMRVEIGTPITRSPYDLAWSPDGRFLVFVAIDEGRPRLWLRTMQTGEARPLSGTDGARTPFWSTDNRSIAYFVAGKLYRISVTGGLPQELADAPAGRGGTWNAEGTILFASTTTSPLLRIQASGGSPIPVTRVDPPHQTGHRLPQFLPDGRRFLFYATGRPETAGIYLGQLEGGQPRRLTAADSAGSFLRPDRVMFVRQGALVTRRLDLTRGELVDDPVTIADPVGYDGVLMEGGFAVAADGRVAYRAPSRELRQLVWFGRTGKRLGVAGDPDETNIQHPNVSPDGQRLAMTRSVGNNQDIWLLDLARGGYTRFTFHPGNEYPAVWSRDGTRIAFNSNHQGPYNLYSKRSGGVGEEELLLDSPSVKVPQSWSRDDKFLLYYEVNSEGGRDLWALNLGEKGRAPLVVAKTPFEESGGQFSPDGRWVAYQTNETGRFEIVVQAFPEPNARWPVSTGGGTQPRWSADGRELYYLAPSRKLMAVPIASSGSTLQAGKAVALFDMQPADTGQGLPQYDVARDGRFLVNVTVNVETPPLTVLLNWTPPDK